MVTVEELITKVQRANEIIQKGLIENGILSVPEVKEVTGIVILRLENGKGVHTTCIGAIDFKDIILALIAFYEHADEYDIRKQGQYAT